MDYLPTYLPTIPFLIIIIKSHASTAQIPVNIR